MVRETKKAIKFIRLFLLLLILMILICKGDKWKKRGRSAHDSFGLSRDHINLVSRRLKAIGNRIGYSIHT